jgi:hypothetical protein
MVLIKFNTGSSSALLGEPGVKGWLGLRPTKSQLKIGLGVPYMKVNLSNNNIKISPYLPLSRVES